jgi:hypothetical protein
MAEISTDKTAEAHRKAVEEEYGQWVATEPISFDGVLAFDTGHAVPVGHVKKFGLDKAGLVESTSKKPDTKSSPSSN